MSKKVFHFKHLMKLPKHKPLKSKYFNEGGNAQYRREVSPLTMEDKFSKFDLPWLSTLRDRAYSAQTAVGRKRTKLFANTVPNPPSFYEDDINK